MSDDDLFIEEEEDEGNADGWMVTYSDLMSLLLCFFVLILSMAEVDIIRYKQLADSMAEAFGVQRDLELESIPKGTSVVSTEFRPGIPDETIIDAVEQVTKDQTRNSLRIGNPDAPDTDEKDIRDEVITYDEMMQLIQETELDAEMLRRLLRTEIDQGQIDVETTARTILIRIREKGSFDSGSALLNTSFVGVIDKIAGALTQIEGKIAVEGHTDNVPINTFAYPSNWDLSAARSVAVVRRMLDIAPLVPNRVTASGFADTRPQANNVSAEGRARNRRVEIVVKQPLNDDSKIAIETALQ
ncbi:type VI secretion system protein TssL [Candidatus Paraluminiphilus aquimaris]|uniref:Type VI secretion system protein TssL n=1 Tax=Candidatus Paraluminiphilus aquimaris TaxID=2518994 RepID=A0ABY6Q3I6_9GAMM|nr:MotB family protein [Candidatus Paraluminiphilus aquimaris]UZP73819.1 type VI secretion system protein TssL [Candidatus Paraluminiphilus aquimaris]